jgi:hypothetical protein
MVAVLLKTKLYIPATRPELIARPRLIDRLNEGLSRKLILVAAPAGRCVSNVEVVSWGRQGPDETIVLNALRGLKAAGRVG